MSEDMSNSSKKEDRKKEPLQTGTANSRFNSYVGSEMERPLTVNVFFDGTGNNRYNTEARLADERYDPNEKGEAEATALEKIRQLEERIQNEEYYQEYYSKLLTMTPAEYEKNKILLAFLKKSHAITSYEKPSHKSHTHLSDQASYTNELTNVALLFLEANGKSDPKIYIEGAGTSKYTADDRKGLGFAAGEVSGVVARVNQAFIDLNEIVREEKTTKLTLNVFGFSRGSFYARVFCAMVKHNGSHHPSGYSRNLAYSYPARLSLVVRTVDITINFVGLYDTVSSHGAGHYNDPKTFPLDIGKEREGIKKIVHLTAQNDYRYHFPLISVTKAIDEGIAFECSLPGAHSDLGGGYTDNWQESRHYLSYQYYNHVERKNRKEGEIRWSWWKEMGYYKHSELRRASPSASELSGLSLTKRVASLNVKNYYQIVAHRTVRHHYQYISLKAMKLSAEEFGKLEFTAKNKRYKKLMEAFERQKGADLLLSKMDQEVTTFIEMNYRKSGRFSFNSEQTLGSKEASQQFYHTYIHNSLQPSTKPLYIEPHCGSWNNQNDAGIPQRPTVRGG